MRQSIQINEIRSDGDPVVNWNKGRLNQTFRDSHLFVSHSVKLLCMYVCMYRLYIYIYIYIYSHTQLGLFYHATKISTQICLQRQVAGISRQTNRARERLPFARFCDKVVREWKANPRERKSLARNHLLFIHSAKKLQASYIHTCMFRYVCVCVYIFRVILLLGYTCIYVPFVSLRGAICFVF